MKIFVTGATGFIGRHFIQQALGLGLSIVAVGRLDKVYLVDQIKWINKELNQITIDDCCDCKCFVHFAAAGVVGGMDNWSTCLKVNVMDSVHAWKCGIEAGVKRYIIAGSCFEYGKSGSKYDYIPVTAPLEPTGAYHASKAAASMAALALAVEYRLQLSILRPFHVYGLGEDGSRLWPSVMRAASAGEDFAMTAGEQVRDFIPVEKVAALFLREVVNPSSSIGEPIIHNLGTGVPKTLERFVTDIWIRMGATGKLDIGRIPYRKDEVMRYVPLVDRNYIA